MGNIFKTEQEMKEGGLPFELPIYGNEPLPDNAPKTEFFQEEVEEEEAPFAV